MTVWFASQKISIVRELIEGGYSLSMTHYFFCADSHVWSPLSQKEKTMIQEKASRHERRDRCVRTSKCVVQKTGGVLVQHKLEEFKVLWVKKTLQVAGQNRPRAG